ncbi:MAG TPA: hypothetical protein DCM68_00870 [Verrucomicrobia bacterium]|nr:hypothetical protein [Verrucomicrobiota bacterium]
MEQTSRPITPNKKTAQISMGITIFRVEFHPPTQGLFCLRQFFAAKEGHAQCRPCARIMWLQRCKLGQERQRFRKIALIAICHAKIEENTWIIGLLAQCALEQDHACAIVTFLQKHNAMLHETGKSRLGNPSHRDRILTNGYLCFPADALEFV